MKINLCMIVKDDSEVKKLNNCLDTIQPYVDQVYITANGKKVKKIKKLCEDRKCHYSYIKWNDNFGEVRNFNFKQAEDCDYILWLDADDLFIGGELIRDLANMALTNGKDGVMLDYWYGCTFTGEPSLETFDHIDIQHPRERLIRPQSVTWNGRLHETPVRAKGAKDNYSYLKYTEKDPIAVMHTATLQDSIEKMQRNLKILNIQLEEEKKKGSVDPRTLLHIIKIYNDLDDKDLWLKGIEYCDEYMEKSGWDEERSVCMEHKGSLYQHLGKHRESVECYLQAIKEWPHNPLPYLRLASAYYLLGNFPACKRWLESAIHIDLKDFGSTVINLTAMKTLTAELMTKLAFNVDKDVKKALQSSYKLVEANPTEENIGNYQFLEDLNVLNNACEHLDKYCRYLIEIGEDKKVPKILFNSPMSIQAQPFAVNLLKKTTPPRKWGEKEICYFANFGGKHFHKWDGLSIQKGIGGSETAVIRLSEEWTKLGYKVTVFGDPEKPVIINGVTYLPYFYFNKDDEFNILIQWRGPFLADKFKAKKFFVDLHDIFHPGDYSPELLKHIDKIFVKSKYHRDLASNIPDDKFVINSNGIL
jgi:tetratricopeptide (TPR) repeat protein